MSNTWTTQDGRVLAIKDMTTEHLRNTIAMLRRQGYQSEEEWAAAFSAAPSGEMASYYWEHDMDRRLSIPVSKELDTLEAELGRRDPAMLAQARATKKSYEEHLDYDPGVEQDIP